MASDQKVAGHLSRALVEVHDGKLYKREGHVLWSAYLKAFVPLTLRWCQQEMSRERKLRLYPKLAEAFEQGRLCKSRVRAILNAVTPETEDVWLAWGTTLSVRNLEVLAQKEAAPVENSREPDKEVTGRPRGRRRAVAAPAGVAVLVAAAVDLARKVEGYQVSRGQAIEAMAMEAMSGVGRWPDEVKEEPDKAMVSSCGIGDETEGAGDEETEGRWDHLSWEFPQMMLEGAPPDDAPAHQRLGFWSQAQGRLDAVRGRLLRIVKESRLARQLRFVSLDQYVRERAGLSAREAEDLIRLDVELSDMPVAFRMYAAGRLGRSAAWLVARAVRLKGDNRTERGWVRYALRHTFRKLEAAVEAAELHRQADWDDFQARGGWPPEEKSFAEVLRMCSHFTAAGDERGAGGTMSSLTFVLDEDQEATYEQALRVLRGLHGQERPEWWCLAVMAVHFVEMYGDADDHVKKTLARRVIQRDEYTCGAPECLRRGGLEADHIELRSRRGQSVAWNEGPLCGPHHRHIKHELGALALYGKAPHDLWVRMGERLYHKDRLVRPDLDENILDEDPWAVSG